MKNEKILDFIRELASYVIIIFFLLFLAKQLGFTNSVLIEIAIGLIIGWAIWKIATVLIDKKRKK